MQVVLLGHVLVVEELADVDRFAVRVAVLRGVTGVLGQAERVERARVGQVVVRVTVLVLVVVEHALQPEEAVEDTVEGRLVATALDQAHP